MTNRVFPIFVRLAVVSMLAVTGVGCGSGGSGGNDGGGGSGGGSGGAGGNQSSANCNTLFYGAFPLKCITPLSPTGYYCCSTAGEGGSLTDSVGYTCPDPSMPSPATDGLDCWQTLEAAQAAPACEGISSIVRCTQ
ncbi:MAG: hypothetical protein WBP56_09655 [Polyangia bacterium]